MALPNQHEIQTIDATGLKAAGYIYIYITIPLSVYLKMFKIRQIIPQTVIHILPFPTVPVLLVST